jgi:hypothetical protein
MPSLLELHPTNQVIFSDVDLGEIRIVSIHGGRIGTSG